MSLVAIKGGDYSVARPDPVSLFNVGWRFACRYLRDLDKSNGDKSLSKTEADSLRNAGITIVSNDETTGTRGLGGYDAGLADATAAHQAAVAAGAPKSRPIYFSPWDRDPRGLTSSQLQTVLGYLRGVGQVLGLYRVGLYAGVELVTMAFDQQLITYGWEAAGWRYDHLRDPRSHIVQYVSKPWQVPGTDADEAFKSDYGQWDVITLADAQDILNAMTAQTKAIFEHTDGLYRLTQRGELPSGSTDGRESIVSLGTRLAVVEAAVQSGVPINLTDEQFDKLAADVAVKLATSGLKMSGTVRGTLDATAELGADA